MLSRYGELTNGRAYFLRLIQGVAIEQRGKMLWYPMLQRVALG